MSELILRRKDGAEETITWDHFQALRAGTATDANGDPLPAINECEHHKTKPLPTRIEWSDEKQAATEAKRIADAAAAAALAQSRALAAPFVYEGNPYACDRAGMFMVDKQRERVNAGRAAVVLVDATGVSRVFAAADFLAFAAAYEAELENREDAVIAG